MYVYLRATHGVGITNSLANRIDKDGDRKTFGKRQQALVPRLRHHFNSDLQSQVMHVNVCDYAHIHIYLCVCACICVCEYIYI